MKYEMKELEAMLRATTLEVTLGKRAEGVEAKTFQVNAADLPLVSVRKALAYGFQRWLNDRIGGSDMTHEDKCADTSIYLAKVMDGSWVDEARGAGTPAVSAETRFGREVVRKWLAANAPDKLKGKKGDEATAYFDKVLADNPEAFADAITAAIEAERAKAAGIKSIAANVKL